MILAKEKMKKEAKDIKIVFTDIDGTLFSHKSHQVPPSAIQGIRDLQKKGIKVFLCSGRNFYLIRKTGILDLVKPDGLVTMNGSNAIINGNIIYRYPIPSTVVDKMVLFAKRLKFGLTLIEENEGHINMIDERVISAHEKYGTRFPQPRTFPDHYDRVVYQMIAFCDSFDESLFLLERIPAKEATGFIGLHNDRTLLEGSVGQEDVMVGALHLLRIRCGMLCCGRMGLGFSFVT